MDVVVTSTNNLGIAPLSLHNLQGALLLWLAGVQLAIVAAVCEIVAGWKNMKLGNRKLYKGATKITK